MNPNLTPLVRRARLQRSWAAAAVVLALVAGCSSGGGAKDTNASEPSASSSGSTTNTTATNGLFDSSVVHEISVTFDQTEYDDMIAEFQSSGDKKWIRATVTIDGTTFKEVGMRLKGNSSLMGLRSTGAGAGGAAGRGGGIGGGGTASTPSALPWLIRLDKYIDGQNINGTSELVVRSNNSQTSLNEAVALDVLALSGQVTQKAIATSFSVNGSAEKLRLAIENPSDDWDDENFANDGVLYKAESGGDYSYRGDDAKSYAEIFDQETDTDNENFAPLTKFLKFINESDDATFAKDLGNYLEVEAFAKYLAGQELVANFDDIDGPGNNSYLRYDEKTGKITILSWDLNLAFGSMGGGGGAIPGGGQFGGGALPSGATGVPGGGPFGGGTLPSGATGFPGGAPPSGAVGGRGARPADGAFPGGAPAGAPGATASGATGAPANGARAAGGGFGGRSNILVTRFLANDTFKALYDKTLASMKADVYGSGKATAALERWKALLNAQASDLVPAATIDAEAASIAAYLKG